MHWQPSPLLFRCAFAGVCTVYRSRLLSSSSLPTTTNCGGSCAGEPAWCALGPGNTGCETCLCGNLCPFMNARAQKLQAPMGCHMFFQCNLCSMISKVPSAARATLLGVPFEYLSGVAKQYYVTKLPSDSRQYRSLAP